MSDVPLYQKDVLRKIPFVSVYPHLEQRPECAVWQDWGGRRGRRHGTRGVQTYTLEFCIPRSFHNPSTSPYPLSPLLFRGAALPIIAWPR